MPESNRKKMQCGWPSRILNTYEEKIIFTSCLRYCLNCPQIAFRVPQKRFWELNLNVPWMPEWLSTGWRRYLLHYAAKFKKICKPLCGTFFGVEYCWATQCTRMFWRQNSSSPSIADCDHAVRGDPRVRAGRHGGELCGVGRGADRGQHAPRRLQLIHQLRILLRRHRSVRHMSLLRNCSIFREFFLPCMWFLSFQASFHLHAQ